MFVNRDLSWQTKTCFECGKVFNRSKMESNGNWKKRKTCGGECRDARALKIRKASYMKESAKKAMQE